jgi:predicted ATPase
VDAAEFERLVVGARGESGVAALATYERALGLWRGGAYAEFADEWWARREVERLTELRLVACEERIDRLIELGRDADAVGDLRGLVAEHPLRSRLISQLMVALDKTGREAEAHRVYRTFHAALRALGLRPDADVATLDRAIAAHHDAGAAPPPEQGGPGNLPRHRVELIGRPTDIDAVLEVLGPGRLVTLTGPGGVGKTQLALHCARRAGRAYVEDGVWLVSLAVASAAAVPSSIANDLGLALTSAVVDGRSIAAALRAQRRLIVLDNCEHVRDRVGDIAGLILDACPHVALLATSREPLAIMGERVVVVPPLSLSPASGPSDAARLFIARAADADISFDPRPGDQSAIETICARLDGMPLALELAAAQEHAIGLEAIGARITGHIDPFRRRHATSRHESLTAAVSWSYDLLTDDERTVFERLSVFTDGFDLDAAVTVAGGPPLDAPVDDVLLSLVDKSLVAVDARSPLRYRQLEVIRQFAADRLAADGGSDAVERRFVDHYARWLVDADLGARGREEATWDRHLRLEWPNLRRAVYRAVDDGDLDAGTGLVWHASWWAIQRSRLELGEWADAVRGIDGFDAHAVAPIVLAVAADIARRRLEYEQFADLLVTAEQLETKLGPAPEPWVQYVAVLRDAVYRDLDPSPAAIELEERARGSLFWTAMSAWADGYMASVRAANATTAADVRDGDVRRVRRSLARAQSLGNPSSVASLELLGAVLRRPDPEHSVNVLHRALTVATELGNEEIASFVRWDLAMVLADLGRLTEVAGILASAIRHYRLIGAHSLAWDMCMAAVRPLIELGEHRTAARVLGRSNTAAVVADWQEWILPADSRRRLLRAADRRQRDRWEAQGATMRVSELVAEVAGALASAMSAGDV